MRTILLVWLALAAPVALPAQAALKSDSFVTADGVTIRYVATGRGAPLILVHGFALSAEINWILPGAVDTLATRFFVVAPDLRGHGRSGKPHDPAAYGATLVNDLLALMDHLKIRRAHVAGYSLGAGIGLKLAAAHPERVISLVMGGSGWQSPDQPPPPFALKWFENLGRAAREGTSVSDALSVPEFPPIPDAMRPLLDRNDPAALLAVFQGLGALAMTEAQLRGVTRPVHAVVGERDERARAAVAAMRQVLPAVQVTVIAGADHAQAMADPRLAHAIREFARRY